MLHAKPKGKTKTKLPVVSDYLSLSLRKINRDKITEMHACFLTILRSIRISGVSCTYADYCARENVHAHFLFGQNKDTWGESACTVIFRGFSKLQMTHYTESLVIICMLLQCISCGSRKNVTIFAGKKLPNDIQLG